MAFGPLYSALPTNGGGLSVVDATSWNTLIGNFSSWQANVNGGGFTLSNVIIGANSIGIGTGTPGFPLDMQGGLLASTAFANYTAMNFKVTSSGGDSDTVEWQAIRNSAGTSSITVGWRLLRSINGTAKSFIGFNNEAADDSVNLGNGGTEYLRLVGGVLTLENACGLSAP